MIQEKKKEAQLKSGIDKDPKSTQKKILKRIKMGMSILRSSTKLNPKPDYAQKEPEKLL